MRLKHKNPFFRNHPTAWIVALLATSLSCHASTWAGADGNWNSNSSPGWNGTGIPNAGGSIASFTSTTVARTTTQNISLGVTVGTLSFTGSAAGSRIIKLTNGITFNQDGVGTGTAVIENTNTSNSASNFLQIGSAKAETITLADNLRITNASGAGANGSVYILGIIGGTGDVTFQNANTAITQAGSIGLGGAANTFTGSVLVQKGTVAFSASRSLGDTNNAVTLGQSSQGSAALLATASSSTIQNNITVASGSGGTLTLGKINSGEATYSGAITLNGDLNIYSEVSNAKGLDFTGVISGNGSITHAPGTAAKATGIIKFSAANTYYGATNLGSPALGTGSALLLANSLALQNSTLNYTGTSKLVFASTVAPKAFTFGGLTGTSGIALENNDVTPVAIDLSVGNNNTNTAYNGILSGAGSLTKIGTGNLSLTGTNTYTGTTTVSSGKLVLNGSTSAVSIVKVSAGSATGIPLAALAGIGTIGGNLTLAAESAAGFKNGGKLAPTLGVSGTNLKVTGTTTFETGSIFEWNLEAAASDTGTTNQGLYGQLKGTGAIDLASGSTGAIFQIVLGTNAFTDTFWDTSKVWNNVFTGSGATNDLTAIFSSFSGSSIDSTGKVTGQGQFAFSGHNSLTWIVPEPTSATIVGALLATTLLRRRRNQPTHQV